MTSFNKILYFGAWAHIEVVDYFPKCNEFVLIDTQPRSEHDEKDYFYEGFYRDKFIDIITKKCKKYGFILDKMIELDPNYMQIDKLAFGFINPHLYIFKNKERTIKYYISTNILFNMNSLLKEDINSSDTLYVAGYFPDVILLKYLNKKINFVGDSETVYFFEEDENENNIISNYIKNKIELNDYYIRFSEYNYYLVWRKHSMIIVCDSLEDISNKKNQLNKNYNYNESD
jgi:hypothetical protein